MNSVHSGACMRVAATSAHIDKVEMTHAGPMTRSCPCRSTRRARMGAQTAMTMMLTADTAPASV